MAKVRKILSYKLKKVFICDRIQRYLKKLCWCGGMADATDSKSVEGNFMWVRLPPPAPPAQALGDY